MRGPATLQLKVDRICHVFDEGYVDGRRRADVSLYSDADLGVGRSSVPPEYVAWLYDRMPRGQVPGWYADEFRSDE